MTRYRFYYAHVRETLTDEVALTSDGAIVIAKRLSRDRGCTVLVRAEDGPVRTVRGVAELGQWRWATPCRRCAATGKTKPSGSADEVDCRRCTGRGWHEE